MGGNNDRREFLKLAGMAGIVFASGLGGAAIPRGTKGNDFFFVQFSDIHWGFQQSIVNPDPRGTLRRAIAMVNALGRRPDFVVFTGDLTHTTADPGSRRRRMAEVREVLEEINISDLRFLPGEHDASLDRGEAYREFFGELYYAFDHGGIHFIAIDNVSDPRGVVDRAQLEWLRADLSHIASETPIVVFAHRPLFDLYPRWGWSTGNGGDVLNALKDHAHVTVFYGHIHQEHHTRTGHIEHHSARSLLFPLPEPGSVIENRPVVWDPSRPFRGLGVHEIRARPSGMHAPRTLGLEAT